jgi:hypothetical protein
MNAASIAGLVVAALLVGAALPVLVQARVSLRAWQRVAEEVGPRLSRSLDEVTEVAVKLRRELAAFEGGGGRVASALESVDDLGRAALELRRTVKVAAAIGAAVGPAIAAATRTMKESHTTSAKGANDTNNANNAKKEDHHEAA